MKNHPKIGSEGMINNIDQLLHRPPQIHNTLSYKHTFLAPLHKDFICMQALSLGVSLDYKIININSSQEAPFTIFLFQL